QFASRRNQVDSFWQGEQPVDPSVIGISRSPGQRRSERASFKVTNRDCAYQYAYHRLPRRICDRPCDDAALLEDQADRVTGFVKRRLVRVPDVPANLRRYAVGLAWKIVHSKLPVLVGAGGASLRWPPQPADINRRVRHRLTGVVYHSTGY